MKCKCGFEFAGGGGTGTNSVFITSGIPDCNKHYIQLNIGDVIEITAIEEVSKITEVDTIYTQIEQLKVKNKRLKAKALAISQAGGFPAWMGQEIKNKDNLIKQLQAENKRRQAELAGAKEFAGKVGDLTYRQIEENVDDGKVKNLLHELVQVGRRVGTNP